MSMSTPPPGAVRKLAIGATVVEAYGRVFTHLALVFRAAAVPFALSVAIVALSFLVAQSGLLGMALAVAGLVPYALFGVACHRLTLLGPAAGAPDLVPSWRPRHWRFLAYMVAVMLIGYAVTMPFVITISLLAGPAGSATLGPAEAILLILGGLAVVVALPYVMMRLSFVFPAVAVDEAYGLGHSWAHTRGQGFRLLAAVLLTALPMFVVFWALGSVLGIFVLAEVSVHVGADEAAAPEAMEDVVAGNPLGFFLSQLVLAAVNYVTMALVLSTISIAFRTCTGWVPGAGGPPARSGSGPDDAGWEDD